VLAFFPFLPEPISGSGGVLGRRPARPTDDDRGTHHVG
jgi:hypothetical protein